MQLEDNDFTGIVKAWDNFKEEFYKAIKLDVIVSWIEKILK